VLIDFGLCAEIEAFDTRHLTSAIVNMMRGNVRLPRQQPASAPRDVT
jgi:hypothetical protein